MLNASTHIATAKRYTGGPEFEPRETNIYISSLPTKLR